MATLSQTLAQVRAPASRNYGYSAYGVAPTVRATPSEGFGSRVNFGSQFENPNLFQSLAVEASNKPVPDANYTPSFDYDPVISKIQSLGTQSVEGAQSNATALKREALINAGASDLGQALGVDQNTIDAAAANPFSTLAQMRKDQEQRRKGLAEALNEQNLYYSGEHERRLGADAEGYAGAMAAFYARLRELFGDAEAGILMAKLKAFTPAPITQPPFNPPPVTTPPATGGGGGRGGPSTGGPPVGRPPDPNFTPTPPNAVPPLGPGIPDLSPPPTQTMPRGAVVEADDAGLPFTSSPTGNWSHDPFTGTTPVLGTDLGLGTPFPTSLDGIQVHDPFMGGGVPDAETQRSLAEALAQPEPAAPAPQPDYTEPILQRGAQVEQDYAPLIQALAVAPQVAPYIPPPPVYDPWQQWMGDWNTYEGY